MRHPFRRFINKFGIDVSRHTPKKDSFDGITHYGIKTIIDVGANVGQFAQEIRERVSGAQIYSFEPIPSVYKELVRNMSYDKKWEGFNYGLGSSIREMEITTNPHTPSSSLLEKSSIMEEVFPHTQGGSREKVRIETLDSVMGKISFEKPLLLKLDVQGYESEVIDGGMKTFSQAKIVLIEASFFSLYKDQPLFDDIYMKLKNLGFIYQGSLQTKRNPKTGENLFEDAIFVRTT